MACRVDLSIRACLSCKTRKKGCDKALPNCGYCTKRELKCSYDAEVKETGLDGRFGRYEIYQELCRLALGHGFDRDHAIGGSSQNLGISAAPYEALRMWTTHALKATGKSLQEIRDIFIAGVYRWLPIIAPWQLSDTELNTIRKELSLDTLLLLLTMSLWAQNRTYESENTSRCCEHYNYLAVKSIFTQLQVVLGLTTALLQAGILIAVYEFASRQPQLAYLTIQTCRGMYEILGNGYSPTQKTMSPNEVLRPFQQCNLARGFAVMERYQMFGYINSAS